LSNALVRSHIGLTGAVRHRDWGVRRRRPERPGATVAPSTGSTRRPTPPRS